MFGLGLSTLSHPNRLLCMFGLGLSTLSHPNDDMNTRNVKTYNVPSAIGDVHGSAEIGDVFRDQYQQLYNSVSYDKGEMDDLVRGT